MRSSGNNPSAVAVAVAMEVVAVDEAVEAVAVAVADVVETEEVEAVLEEDEAEEAGDGEIDICSFEVHKNELQSHQKQYSLLILQRLR